MLEVEKSVTIDIEKLKKKLPKYTMKEIHKIVSAVLDSISFYDRNESTTNYVKTESIPTINPAKDESSGVDYSIKADGGKYQPTLCHPSLIEAVARVRMFGASRYGGTETWKRVEEQRYRDALYRHWLAYIENPDGVDEESGFPHLWHMACNVDFLVEMQKERMKNDRQY